MLGWLFGNSKPVKRMSVAPGPYVDPEPYSEAEFEELFNNNGNYQRPGESDEDYRQRMAAELNGDNYGN